ncbi:MAG: hypothetical protein IKL47_06795 [Clostridia bacterium]|nr:hypothetical protein [Clostridia bacterium]
MKRDVFAVLGVFVSAVAYILAVLLMYSDVFGNADNTEENTANTSNTPILNFSCKIKFDFDV